MVLAQKQIYGPLKENREPRNKPTNKPSTKEARIYKGEKAVSPASGIEKAGELHLRE